MSRRRDRRDNVCLAAGNLRFPRVYMPYLMYGYAATVVLMLAGCCVIARTVPGLRGVRLLGWALGFGLLGVLLLAMRPFAPAWVTILLANEALFVCSLLIYSATADTLDVAAPFVPWGIGIMVAALPALGYFAYVRVDLSCAHSHLQRVFRDLWRAPRRPCCFTTRNRRETRQSRHRRFAL